MPDAPVPAFFPCTRFCRSSPRGLVSEGDSARWWRWLCWHGKGGVGVRIVMSGADGGRGVSHGQDCAVQPLVGVLWCTVSVVERSM